MIDIKKTAFNSKIYFLIITLILGLGIHLVI